MRLGAAMSAREISVSERDISVSERETSLSEILSLYVYMEYIYGWNIEYMYGVYIYICVECI